MARKCRNCRTEIPPKKKCTDQIQAGGFCNIDCLALHGREKAQKARERKAKKERSEVRRKKAQDNHNNKPHQEKLTEEACNKMIRLLDEGEPCISCGRYQCGSAWNAGHFQSVASSPEIRFDPRNIHLQGAGCNFGNRRPDMKSRRKSDTIAKEYEQRLRERHGNEMVDWVLGPHEMPHFSCDELRALRAVFNAESRNLERGHPPSRNWRALNYSVRGLIE